MRKINNLFIIAVTFFINVLSCVAITTTVSNVLPNTVGPIDGVIRNEVGGYDGNAALSGQLLQTGFYTSVKLDTNNSNSVLFCTDHEAISPSKKEQICEKNDNWSIEERAAIAAIIQMGNGAWNSNAITETYLLVTYTINQYLGKNGMDKYSLVGTTLESSYNDYVNAANEAKANAATPTLTLSSNELVFTKKNGKYVSNEITVNSNMNEYEVTISNNVGVVNKNGNKFTISVDESSENIVAGTPLNVNVSVSVSKTVAQARNYSCGTYQTVTPANWENLTLEETVNLTGRIELNTSLTIKKVDEDNKLLPGVVLKIESKENDYTQTITTSDKEIKLEGLKFGKYTITEISTPAGYVKIKNPMEVTLSNDNLNEVVTLKNSLTRVEISKISANDSKLLEGATLQIQDKDGNVLTNEEGKKYEWTSTKEIHVITGLVPGTYYLVEISSPKGYELNKNKIEFKVDGEKDVVKVEMKNNIEVKVPDTLSSRSALLLSVSMFDIFLGIGILLYVKKHKTQE